MRITRSELIAALGAGFVCAAAAQEPTVPSLVITGVVPDIGRQALTISGERFGARPFVTLDLVPLAIRSATDSEIVAAAPLTLIPPGRYLLTVSRGPAPGESASMQVMLGGNPAAPAPAPAPDPAPPTLSPAGSDIAARVGDRAITVAEVDEEWRRTDPGSFVRVSRAIYDERRRLTEAMVTRELLTREAAARGVTLEALLDVEIPRRRVPLPDSSVLALYQSLGDRARGATLDEMRPALRAWLERTTEPELARMNYVEELMKTSTRASVLLAPPRVRVARTPRDPVLGPETAPVELVVFGDLQSTDYFRFAQQLGRVRDTFGERVRLVFKHLPQGGLASTAAAEAALCAGAQGRFWSYHDALVAQARPLLADRMRRLASEAGLDREAFDRCLDQGSASGAVREALDEAARYGITAQPAFLVNGRLAPAPPSFLPPFEFFTRIVEQELLQLSRGPR